MLDNLWKFIDDLERTPEFDLDGHISLVEVEKKANKLELKYLVHTGIDNKPSYIWKIVCDKVREHKIIFGEQYGNFKLYQDHVLFWSYHQPKLFLTFSNNPCNVDVDSVVGQLYPKHYELIGEWIPFHSYFNCSKHLTLQSLLRSRHGKLAEGAEKIILGYQEVLNKCGFKSSYLSYSAKYWDDDNGWINEDGRAQVLITDLSYVVASKFTAIQIED